ncbi:hypothetical protein [Nevskia sp.]|nr:hypothetical protein [Nevskia sp.]
MSNQMLYGTQGEVATLYSGSMTSITTDSADETVTRKIFCGVCG